MKPCSASVTPRVDIRYSPAASAASHSPRSARWNSSATAWRSVERWLAVAGPLQLEEAVRLGHQRQAVPQPSGRLPLRGWRDNRAEQGPAPNPDDRRSDVKPHLVERLVV